MLMAVLSRFWFMFYSLYEYYLDNHYPFKFQWAVLC